MSHESVHDGGTRAADGVRRPLRVAAVQWSPGEDADANGDAAVALVRGAAAAGARLIVLPEYSQHWSRDLAATAPAAAEAIEGPFVSALHAVAAELDVVIVAGLVERVGQSVVHDAVIHNTVVAVASAGVEAAYRKVHLYDAFGGRESEWLTAGSPEQQPVIDVFGHAVGIETCYDLRFPESTRRLVDAGADVIVIPAQWARGPQKERHWTALVTARAIESTVHVIAADQAPPSGAGCTTIVDPMGVVLASLGEAPGIAHAIVDAERTLEVRAVNPSLANRRYRVHPA